MQTKDDLKVIFFHLLKFDVKKCNWVYYKNKLEKL